ncbi:hypothetical protein P12x_001546 [Tundrisphaera lichenicola]|uniref:hypothetical protein n=1 Tax=Tundrisphaera lichenicola TaxID=2029860 RepID=UPI003EBFC911
MAQTTEAACLLQSGAMYPARVGLLDGSSEVLLGVKSGGFSLYRGDEPIYHFDLEGRWQRAFLDGVHYLKGLDTTTRAILRGREGSGMVLRRRILGPSEAQALDESIRRDIGSLIDRIDSGKVTFLSPPAKAREIGPSELREYLECVSGWDPRAWEAHRARYEATYDPWPFLPPDCPNPIVLQATTGRDFGRASAKEFRVRSVREFEEHLIEVRAILGRRESQCRDLVLAGSDVLLQPFDQVFGYLEEIGSRFSEYLGPDRPGAHARNSRANEIHALLDDFPTSLPDPEGWRRWKGGRLGRVTLAIESGDPTIRRVFGKFWKDESLHATLANIKGAGIGVGLVVLLGAGGRSGAEAHLGMTSDLIRSLPMDETDLVWLVDARILGDSSVIGEPLSDDETAGQILGLKQRIAGGQTSKGPRLVPYNPEKQWT